jgi:hypothetical protein
MHRAWTATCYEAFVKAQIQRDADGKPIYTRVDNGRMHITYLFKCKMCVTVRPSFD